jgi:hypothetical protein
VEKYRKRSRKELRWDVTKKLRILGNTSDPKPEKSGLGT